MALLTLAQIREHIESDLDNDPLQRLLDETEAEIVRLYGEHATQIDYLDGGEKYLFPSRVVSTVTTLVETEGGTDTSLVATDYSLVYNGRGLLRLNSGTNPRSYWGDSIKLTYVPVSDLDQRERVQVDLVKLETQYNAVTAEKAGNWSATYPEYEAERTKIIERLRPRHRIFI